MVILIAIANRCIVVDGDVMESAGGVSQLGFFSPRNSQNLYLGLWYKKTGSGTVFWVANREDPVIHIPGVLRIDDHGNLVLTDAKTTSIWSSNSSGLASTGLVSNAVAQLLDSGNLVVRDEYNTHTDGYLWPSFDYPGKYTCSISLNGYPQLVLRSGSAWQYRLGSWDGMKFDSKATSIQSQDLTDKFVVDKYEIYYNYGLWNIFILMLIMLTLSGTLQLSTWNYQNENWVATVTAQVASVSEPQRIPAYEC